MPRATLCQQRRGQVQVKYFCVDLAVLPSLHILPASLCPLAACRVLILCTSNMAATKAAASADANGSEPAASSSKDRIYVDNTNISELKATCDDAVERILTRTSMASSLAPAPKDSPYASGASSPTSPTSPASSTLSLPRVPADGTTEPFPPFKASHFHTDLRLALGFTASAVMIGTSIWAYLVEKDWNKNKMPSAIAVIM